MKGWALASPRMVPPDLPMCPDAAGPGPRAGEGSNAKPSKAQQHEAKKRDA